MAQYESYRGQQGGYGQSQPYGDPSPYGQAGNPYDQNNGGDPYSQGQYDRQGYEMNNMGSSNANRLLNQCREIDGEIDALDAKHDRLRSMNTHCLQTNASRATLDEEMAVMMGDYEKLFKLTQRIRQDRESGSPRNSSQVGKTVRKVQASLQKFRQLDAEFRRGIQEQMGRDYRNVRPDASEAEVREAISDPNNTQVYSQALLSGDRRGNVNSIAKTVTERHEAIQKITQDMEALGKMFQDLDALVIQQETQVASIEQKGEETVDHVTKGNVELDGAVTKARAARKKKWICLGIAVLIVIIIVVVVVVVVEVTKK